ncbi:MAG: zf-HC2 domain-containing protein [Calditrichaeota bacterium]|nr:MAG: zf-HC2 domain-containing protein [Calditrichota bacterium]
MKNCQPYKELIMKEVDGEITPSEKEALFLHLKECADCRKELEEFQKLKEVTGTMKKQLFPEMAWEEYWNHLYNRIERGISWILISIGSVILLVYGIYHGIMELLGDPQLPTLIKGAILLLIIGGVLLLVSVIREKLMVRKYDKYKEVKQ